MTTEGTSACSRRLSTGLADEIADTRLRHGYAPHTERLSAHDIAILTAQTSRTTESNIERDTMKRTPVLSTIFLLVVLILTGCEADSMEDDADATVMLRLQPMVGTDAYTGDESTVYMVNGQAMTFTSARMYLSEITLLRDDGDDVTITGASITGPALDSEGNTVTHTTNDRIVLAKHDAGEETHDLGDVPAGTYTGVRFRLGMTGTTNRMDPTQVPASHALAQQTDKNNHWSWNSGYIYLRMDGYLDIDGDDVPDDSQDAEWYVHLGMDQFSNVIEIDETFSLAAGEMQNLHIMANYAALIQNVDYTDPGQRDCHTMNNMPVAQKVHASMGDAFMLPGVHMHN